MCTGLIFGFDLQNKIQRQKPVCMHEIYSSNVKIFLFVVLKNYLTQEGWQLSVTAWGKMRYVTREPVTD